MADLTVSTHASLNAQTGGYLSMVRRKRMYSGVLLILFIALMASGFRVAEDRNAGGFLNGILHVFDFPAEVISEAWTNRGEIPALLAQYFPSLIETINIGAVATLIGALLAAFTALLSTRGLARWPRLIPLFRRIMDGARAVPEVVIALVLVFVLGGGPIPAVIAIALHTAGALGKQFSEVAENADLKPIDGLASVGATWGKQMWLGVIPQVAPNWLSYALLRFEINVRASAILGFVGSGGIGYDLKIAMQWGQGRYDQVVAIFLLLFVTIMLIDQVSSRYRNVLIKGKAVDHSGQDIFQLFRRKKYVAFAVPAVLFAYLTYTAFAFNIGALLRNAEGENAAILLSDFWSHKTHVTHDNRTGDLEIAIEGENKGTYPDGMLPDWVSTTDGTTRIDLGDGHLITYADAKAFYEVPDYGTITLGLVDGKVTVDAPEPLPDWISVSSSKVGITTDHCRLSITKSKIETFKYEAGWELFFFTLDSPFYGKGPLELAALALGGERVDASRSNLGYIVSEVWTNKLWHHNVVLWAIFETILMAFLGTMFAALIALPLAFVAAANFNALKPVRFAMRRVFDFVRGVDGLIWTIILSRAFGPGPMTGALAIMTTDTGTFGKMFSEALENVDERQIEGVASTGANKVQRIRFGVLPQIAPVLLAQVLYYLESNTRSATVIGSIVGGGIGLLLTQAITTQKDWEEVAYYMVLIVLMVMLMDSLSGWLRRKLIKGE